MSLRGNLERRLRRVWRGEQPVLAWLLWPLSLLWRMASALHRSLYAAGLLKRERLAAPVISVGNLTVGGTGKTPVTLELSRHLLDAGRRVAVLSRGYGRKTKGVVIVSDGQAIRATAADGGDEPLWLARKEPRLIVVVGEKRAAAGAAALDLGADLLILDDGLSHYALHRDFDVVVIDDATRFGNGHFLPAGPLRLSASFASQADLVWWSRLLPEDQRPSEPKALVDRPSVHSTYRPQGLFDLELHPSDPLSTLHGKRVLAVCGIAKPDAFETMVEGLGANVRGLLAFADHHPFTVSDVAQIERTAREERCELIVTTEKDAMRLSGIATGAQYRAVAMETLVRDTTALTALVRRFTATPQEAA